MKRLMILLFAVAVLAGCATPTPIEVTKIVKITKEVPTTPVPPTPTKEIPVTSTPVPGSEQWAIDLAEAIITNEYPEFDGADRRTSSASVKGRDFWVVTYLQTVQVEGRTGPVDLTRAVVICVNKATGDVHVAESP